LLGSLYDSEFAESVRIIYGGSMNSTNAAEFISSPDIDGGLIGGASLKAEDFLAICRDILS
jgi:triosephosphate isomerase